MSDCYHPLCSWAEGACPCSIDFQRLSAWCHNEVDGVKTEDEYNDNFKDEVYIFHGFCEPELDGLVDALESVLGVAHGFGLNIPVAGCSVGRDVLVTLCFLEGLLGFMDLVVGV